MRFNLTHIMWAVMGLYLGMVVLWFHKGSEKGDSFAIHNLAGSYLEGKGVKKNHELAIEWYEKSAELGY
ncbi:MAG: tetratricopeptide repeat protein, partial [Akkermansiaceae bacterium]